MNHRLFASTLAVAVLGLVLAGTWGWADDGADALAQLERKVEAKPRNLEARHELGRAYYERARALLDRKQFDAYETYLGRAMDQWIAALRIAPENPSPHTWMGIVAAYQGNLDAAEQNFQNARRLSPRSPVSYTNLAQIEIYDGELTKARRYLAIARKYRAPAVIVELNESLAAWRQGDMVEARDLFESAYSLDPREVNTWDEAPVADPIESFHDFTEYCCSNPACGPYMENACHDMRLEVKRREVDAETVRQELLLEMERRRRLAEIYKRRTDLEIEIERPETTE